MREKKERGEDGEGKPSNANSWIAHGTSTLQWTDGNMRLPYHID